MFCFLFGTADSHWADSLERVNYCSFFWIWVCSFGSFSCPAPLKLLINRPSFTTLPTSYCCETQYFFSQFWITHWACTFWTARPWRWPQHSLQIFILHVMSYSLISCQIYGEAVWQPCSSESRAGCKSWHFLCLWTLYSWQRLFSLFCPIVLIFSSLCNTT